MSLSLIQLKSNLISRSWGTWPVDASATGL